MRNMKTKLAEAVLAFVLGVLFAIGVGVLIFGSQVFNYHSKTFFLLTDGLAGAAVFGLYRLSNVKVAILAAVLFAVVLGFIGQESHTTVFVHSIIFLLVLTYASRTLWGGEKRSPFIIKMIYLAVALALAGVLITVILTFITGGPLYQEAVLDNVVLVVLTGIGLGFGFEIADLLGRVIRNAQRAD